MYQRAFAQKIAEMNKMKDTYYYENGIQFCKDLEFNGIVYGMKGKFQPNKNGKIQASNEAYYWRNDGHFARAVLMEDGAWCAYASYSKKGY
tara:strand:- start:930 stop:1202 length:273 start_codon:yes stop_codon:yes gene_type:complete